MTFLSLSPGPEPVLQRDAILSPCGRYRYSLTRSWGEGSRVLFVMLNPSTADAAVDDPTIRRCIGFARSWGHGSLEVVNLWAFRATEPSELRAALKRGEDAIGPFNDHFIARAAERAQLIVAAWGAHIAGAKMQTRATVVRAALGASVSCLGWSSGNQPRHPLMLAAATALEPFPASMAGGGA